MYEGIPPFCECDRLAVGFIDGNFDEASYRKLNPIGKSLVTSLAGLYASARIGFCSGKQCAKNKYELISHHRLLATNLVWIVKEHKDWCERTKNMSSQLCKLSKAINAKDPEAFPIALKIIDALTREDVLNKMLFHMDGSEAFKTECVNTLLKNEDYFFSNFGDIPYMDLLYKFFNSCKEENISLLFKELDTDNIKKIARRVPVKKDCDKSVYESYIKLMS